MYMQKNDYFKVSFSSLLQLIIKSQIHYAGTSKLSEVESEKALFYFCKFLQSSAIQDDEAQGGH